MNMTQALLGALWREARFSAKDRSIWLWIAITFCLSSLAVGFGLAEINQQRNDIARLIDIDQQDRAAKIEKQNSWGRAAYYSFHLSYDEPSDFAFAAIGQRDAQPWKHRIRMLALEGQIYERDVGNPSFALIGRFDFAFLAAFIIPLILIILLYDLRSSERDAGRFKLLEATARDSQSLWSLRATVRSAAIYISLITPLLIAGLMSRVALGILVSASLMVLAYVIFWTLICAAVSRKEKPAGAILTSLIAIWLSTAVIIPGAAKLSIDQAVEIPSASEILLVQREAVNDAWDLPRQTTMTAFFQRYPEWKRYQKQEGGFEWQWYYAFQQVGDQKVEAASTAYREGRQKRDQLARWASLIAPPSLLERSLQSLASTDLSASLAYEESIRRYHEELKDFYYPKFFQNQSFDKALLKNLPEYGK